jgi:hypothetical protein
MTLHTRINGLIAFGGSFELSVWMDKETLTVRALLTPRHNDRELKRRLYEGGIEPGEFNNPVLEVLSTVTWFPLGLGQTPDSAMQALEDRLVALPRLEVLPDNENERSKWMRSIDRVASDMADWSDEGVAAGVAAACKNYPSNWNALNADKVFS